MCVCTYILQATIGDILQRKDALRKVEDLGAQVEEALIFDNKSDTHSLTHTHTHTHTHTRTHTHTHRHALTHVYEDSASYSHIYEHTHHANVSQEEKIGTVQGSADRLIQARHYAAVEVAERRAAVLARWSQLKTLLGAWRNKLGQSLSFQQFKREADEAELWVGQKMQVACDDSYKDPTDLPVSGTLEYCQTKNVWLLVRKCEGGRMKHRVWWRDVCIYTENHVQSCMLLA